MLRGPDASADRHPHSRNSLLRLPAAVILGAMMGLKGKLIDLIRPVEQPVPMAYVSGGYPDYIPLPGPDANIEEILALPAHRLQEFLALHGRHKCIGLREFFGCYRDDPETLQSNKWSGPCNQFAQLLGEWGARHGHPVYIVNMYPSDPAKRLKNEWHQIAVICMEEDKRYLVANRSSIEWWNGTVEEYIAEHESGQVLMPLCGIQLWRRTQPNFAAHITMDLGSNQKPVPSPVPIPIPPPPRSTSVH